MTDENLLGAIFANVEDTIEKTIQLIKEVTKQKNRFTAFAGYSLYAIKQLLTFPW